jgi:hypothetical protein
MGDDDTRGTRDPAEAPDLGDRRQAQEAYHHSDKRTSHAPTDGAAKAPRGDANAGDHRLDGPDVPAPEGASERQT